MLKKWNLIFSVLFMLCVFAFTGYAQQADVTKQGEVEITKAIAVLHPTDGYSVHGTVTFTKVDGGIKVVADVQDLSPGKHGFHIHSAGDCSAIDASSAGGHFNPEGTKHGGPESKERHVGDLGNLVAGDDGQAHYEWVDPLLSFEGLHDIIGRAVIVHLGPDDLTSQPSGNAGPRVACGVIGIID
ncbi:MAG: superoxide dismutase family protein [Calditrichia bacterium]